VSAFLCWLEKFQTLAVGLVGFTGVMITLARNARLAREQHARQVEHERAVVRIALRAELEANAAAYRDRIDMLSGEATEGRHSGFVVTVNPMNEVYKSQMARIGLLSESQVRPVLKAYLLVQQLPDRIKLFADSTRPTEPGSAWIPKEAFGPFVQMHQNYLRDLERAISSLEPLISGALVGVQGMSEASPRYQLMV
jgi:hypothetical protein